MSAPEGCTPACEGPFGHAGPMIEHTVGRLVETMPDATDEELVEAAVVLFARSPVHWIDQPYHRRHLLELVRGRRGTVGPPDRPTPTAIRKREKYEAEVRRIRRDTGREATVAAVARAIEVRRETLRTWIDRGWYPAPGDVIGR